MKISDYFLFKGRISPIEFKKRMLILIALQFIVAILSNLLTGIVSQLLSLLLLCLLFSQVSFIVRRLNDANVSKEILIKFIGLDYFIHYFALNLWSNAVTHFTLRQTHKLSQTAQMHALMPYANILKYSSVAISIVFLVFLYYVYSLPSATESNIISTNSKSHSFRKILKYFGAFIIITIAINIITSFLVSGK